MCIVILFLLHLHCIYLFVLMYIRPSQYRNNFIASKINKSIRSNIGTFLFTSVLHVLCLYVIYILCQVNDIKSKSHTLFFRHINVVS